CFAMTSSKTSFSDAGNANPATFPTAISSKPSARIPFRGFRSAQASGNDFHASFFFSSFLSESTATAPREAILSPCPIRCVIASFHYIRDQHAHGNCRGPSIRWGKCPEHCKFPAKTLLWAAEGALYANFPALYDSVLGRTLIAGCECFGTVQKRRTGHGTGHSYDQPARRRHPAHWPYGRYNQLSRAFGRRPEDLGHRRCSL